jgi:hypothetical protein
MNTSTVQPPSELSSTDSFSAASKCLAHDVTFLQNCCGLAQPPFMTLQATVYISHRSQQSPCSSVAVLSTIRRREHRLSAAKVTLRAMNHSNCNRCEAMDAYSSASECVHPVIGWQWKFFSGFTTSFLASCHNIQVPFVFA